jgi:hypothetical protein
MLVINFLLERLCVGLKWDCLSHETPYPFLGMRLKLCSGSRCPNLGMAYWCTWIDCERIYYLTIHKLFPTYRFQFITWDQYHVLFKATWLFFFICLNAKRPALEEIIRLYKFHGCYCFHNNNNNNNNNICSSNSNNSIEKYVDWICLGSKFWGDLFLSRERK